MKYHLLTYLILFSLCSFSQNQQQLDSLEIADLLKKAESFNYKNNDSALYYYNKAQKKAALFNNWTSLGTALLGTANVYYTLEQDNLAMRFYIKADSVLNANHIINRTSFASAINISRLLSFSLNTKSDTVYFKKIQSYLFKAINLAKDLKYPAGEAIAYNEYAKLLSVDENYIDASVYYKKAVDVVKNVNNNKIKSLVYWGLASNYYNLNKIDSATYYYKKRITLFENSNKQKELALAYSSLGGFYNKIKHYKEAILYQSKALKLFDSLKIKDPSKILGTMNGLATAYANNKQYKYAYNLVDKAYILHDSLTLSRNSKKTLELEAKYQTGKKEHEIGLLKEKNNRIEHQKMVQRNELLGGITLASILGLSFFVLYRNRKKTTKKLQELDKAKSNFFTNISHEFRTPLTLISGPVQQQLKKKNISKKDRSSLEMIQRNSDRLLSLVDQLLDFSKIEAGRLQLKVSKYEIKPFLGTLMDGFKYTAKQKQIEYTINTDLVSANVWFDKNVLEKIVLNLLSNAFKYTPDNGEIVCIACIKDDYLHFEVKNTGAGLSEEELTKIFERFYQVNENQQGVGIGLALVKELVKLHHGTINVDSELNGWTSFKIVLPINKSSFKKSDLVDENFNEIQSSLNAPIDSESDQYQEVQDTDMPILLIADDNADVRNYVSNLFKDTYTILQAKNGQEGIALAMEHVPDIIISDIMMPIKNGIELCDTLKSNECTSHIPIILLTAKAGTENEIKGIKTGADDYITKPFHDNLLLFKVEQLVDIRRKLQKRYSQEVILRPKDIAITSVDEHFLERLQNVLDEKLIESKFSIEDFSNAVGMSRMQLHRKLKALTGLSTSEFIRSQRLKLAAQLLKKSEINVSQVGYSVGFNNHAYFSKCFKELYHCTPTEFAKKNK